MFSFIILTLLVCAEAQSYYYRQQQQRQQQQPILFNNYNSRQIYSQNYAPGYQVQQQSQGRVRGNLISDDTSMLPAGSQIIVSLTDVSLQDVASRPLNTLVLYGSYRFPIAFDIPYSISQVQSTGNIMRQYAVQARIENNGQLLYISDRYTPVQLIPSPMNPVNVYMKRISSSTFPTNGGIFTTRPPLGSMPYFCLQAPDIGPCKASIPQYYFNARFGSCQIFYWGGCAGNQNRFDTFIQCQRACSAYPQQIKTSNLQQQ